MAGKYLYRNVRHAYWCVVDGGTRRHRNEGFWCPRCAEQSGGPARQVEELLGRIDNHAKGA